MARVAHGWWVMVFLHDLEVQGLVVRHVQVVAIREVSVILPTVSRCDSPLVLGAASPEAVQDLCWKWVSIVGFIKKFS